MSVKLRRKMKSIKSLTHEVLLDEYKKSLSDIDYDYQRGFLKEELCEYSARLATEILLRMHKK